MIKEIIPNIKSDSRLPKKFNFFLSLKALLNDEEFLLFHPKSSFLSQDI